VPSGVDHVDVTLKINGSQFDAGEFYYLPCSFSAACFGASVNCTADSASYAITVGMSSTGEPTQTQGNPAQFISDVTSTFVACENTPSGLECLPPVTFLSGDFALGCPPLPCEPNGRACDGRCGIEVADGCGGNWYCGACGGGSSSGGSGSSSGGGIVIKKCPTGTYRCGNVCC